MDPVNLVKTIRGGFSMEDWEYLGGESGLELIGGYDINQTNSRIAAFLESDYDSSSEEGSPPGYEGDDELDVRKIPRAPIVIPVIHVQNGQLSDFSNCDGFQSLYHLE